MEMAHVKVDGVRAVVEHCIDIPARIKGATVRLTYADFWTDLSKTVVFQVDGVTKDVLNAGEVVKIPPEVVANVTLTPIRIGIYGVSEDGKLAIPTFWATIGRVKSSTDPSGDESTDPSLPVWVQLQEQINDLKSNPDNNTDITDEEFKELSAMLEEV